MSSQMAVGWISAMTLALNMDYGLVAFSAAEDAPLAGRWDAVVVAAGVDVPFPFEITGDGRGARRRFFNGDRRITSTAATPTGAQRRVPLRAVRRDPAA